MSTATASIEPGAEPAAPARDRVPMRQKVGYGLGSWLDVWGHWLYQSLAFHVFNVFLGVAPGLISTALGIKILLDAVSDAIFGWLSDNTRTRWGRRRPFMLVGGVLAGVGLPLMFAVGRGWSDQAYFTFIVVSLCIYVPVMSCFAMPWSSLGTEMTPDYHERTAVMQVKNAIQKVPELGMFVAAQFTTLAIFKDEATGKPDILLGAQVYASILGAIMVAVSLAVFMLVRERYYEKLVVKSKERVPFKDTLYRTLANKPFRILLGTKLAVSTSTAMVGLLGYYTTLYYVCKGDVTQGTQWNSAMGVSGMVMGLAGVYFAGWVAERTGKRNALIVALVLLIGGFIGDWFFYNPNIPWLQIFASGCVAFAGAGFWTISSSMMADIVDHDELATGQRREGSFSACQSWIIKAGLALGNGASGWILQLTGFDAKLPVQSEEAIFIIRVLLTSIPTVGLLVALVIISRMKLTEKGMHDIRVQLEARRGQV